jgi:hypothetical protein
MLLEQFELVADLMASGTKDIYTCGTSCDIYACNMASLAEDLRSEFPEDADSVPCCDI